MQSCTPDRTPQEYHAFGLGEMREGALTVRQPDGTRTADLRLVSVEAADGNPKLFGLPAPYGENCMTLNMKLHDELLGLDVTLQYSIFDDCAAITRGVLFENHSDAALYLERRCSVCLDMPDRRYDLITLSGACARECESARCSLPHGDASSVSYTLKAE